MVFPKDLQYAHDKVVGTINKLERELEQKAYMKRLDKIKAYEQEIDDFVFVVSKDLQEIVREGSELHHCVSSKNYLDSHVKGDTTDCLYSTKKKTPKSHFLH